MTPLTLVQMVFRLFQVLLLFMLKFAIFCHVDNFDSTQLDIFELIQIWECALNWFTMKPNYEPKLDICHLHGLGATCLEHGFG